MNKPEQHQIDHWIKVSLEGLTETSEDLKNGFYVQENIPLQSVYTGSALSYSSLGRAKFLNGDPILDVRKEFGNASICILKSFQMAYDKSDPDYLGDKWPRENPHYTGEEDSAKWKSPGYGEVSFADVCEVDAIEGIYYALIADDLKLAFELASWFRDNPAGYKMDIEVNRYAHALKNTIKKNYLDALAGLKIQLEDYNKKPAKKGYRLNYYNLSKTLHSILTKNQKEFDKSLLTVLKFYDSLAHGEYKNTDEGFICDSAAALANLGIRFGLKININYDTLPHGLLITG